MDRSDGRPNRSRRKVEPTERCFAHTGVIGSADCWTIDPQDIALIHADFSAACEDMETAYIAQICELHSIPFIGVRSISDNESVVQLTPKEVPAALEAAGERAAHILVELAGQL